ncbi:hypothetical protein Bbelb_222450 [Branchiostoma belcheri]|nr:hypothetical protein Bbelb_222450 [Branchiostoma belcheri]
MRLFGCSANCVTDSRDGLIHELHIPRILCAQGRVNHVTHPRLWSKEVGNVRERSEISKMADTTAGDGRHVVFHGVQPRMSHVVYPTLCAKDPGNVQLVNCDLVTPGHARSRPLPRQVSAFATTQSV